MANEQKKTKNQEQTDNKETRIGGPVCRIPLTPEEQEQKSEPAQLYEITWRIFRIMAEFVEGFQFLSNFSHEVTIFGSARTPEDDKWYREARKLGGLLSKNGFTVVTGGGPGIMEAANRGAYEEGGESIGLNIQLPTEQRINPYVKKYRGFHYFFTRKVMLAASAQVYVFFPGGFGTMDELFELVTLVQTGKSQPIPILLVGKDYWSPLLEWIENTVVKEGKVGKEDFKIIKLLDSADEVIDIVCQSSDRSFF